MAQMMKCGHVANAKNDEGSPVCVICYGIASGADVVVEGPNLEGRQSKCPYCKKTTPSSLSLPFFEYRPQFEMDSHYCGCYGWD